MECDRRRCGKRDGRGKQHRRDIRHFPADRTVRRRIRGRLAIRCLADASPARIRRAQHDAAIEVIVRLDDGALPDEREQQDAEEHPPRRGSIPATLHPRFAQAIRAAASHGRRDATNMLCCKVSHLNLPREACPWREHGMPRPVPRGALEPKPPTHRATTIAPARVA